MNAKDNADLMEIVERLVAAAEKEVVGIGQDPGCAAMALLMSVKMTCIRHGNHPFIAATLLEYAFQSCGVEVDGLRMVEEIMAAAKSTVEAAKAEGATVVATTAGATRH
ncbi:MAG: hypothetical protein AB1918_11595 [Pseudomonadota bacterium]